MRPAEAAFRARLYYALLTCGNSVETGGNQQISPCFLQDLQSEVDLPQTRRSYQRVKLQRGCEGVTVCRRVAARGSQDHVVSGSRGASRLLQWFGLHPWWPSVPLQAGDHVSYMRTTSTTSSSPSNDVAARRTRAPRRVTDVARHRTTTLRCVAFTNGRLGMEISAGQWYGQWVRVRVTCTGNQCRSVAPKVQQWCEFKNEIFTTF